MIATDSLEAGPADVVIALAGDFSGQRAFRAAELVEAGAAPVALLNGAFDVYGVHECRQAAAMVQERRPQAAVEPHCFHADSTLEESRIVDEELRRRGAKRALVVTSDFHTRRASYIFRKHTSGEVEYDFTSAPTPDFKAESWWQTRSGQMWFFCTSLNLWNRQAFKWAILQSKYLKRLRRIMISN